MFFFRDKADERATCVNSIHHYYLRSPSNIQFSMDPMTDQWLPTSSTSSPMMLGKYKPQPMHLQQWSSTGKSFNQKPSEAWGSFPLATFHSLAWKPHQDANLLWSDLHCGRNNLLGNISHVLNVKAIFLLWLLEGMGCSADKSHCGNPGAALCQKAQKKSQSSRAGLCLVERQNHKKKFLEES